jgi:hypothetical protein
LPKLHLSAAHLVHLRLENIPHPGYISPEAIVALSSPRCPTSTHFPLDSNPLNLALTANPDVLLHQNVLSSLLSATFISKGSSNI